MQGHSNSSNHIDTTKCDVNMHRLNSYKGSSSLSFEVSVVRPVRSVNTLSWNMLQSLRIFSSCKCSFGTVINVPSEAARDSVASNRNIKNEIPYLSWVNLVNPKFMPNLRMLEICVTSSSVSWDPTALRHALLELYPSHDMFRADDCLSRVKIALRVQFSSSTTGVLSELGPEVMLLVQSLVISITGKSSLPILNDNAFDIIELMKNVEHVSIESYAKTIPTSISRGYRGGISGLRSGTRSRAESRKGSPVRLINLLKKFKHLKRLELPSWTDLSQTIDAEVLETRSLTDLTCDLDHIYQLSSKLSGLDNRLRYPLFESLQSLEIFIPKHHDVPELDPGFYSQLKLYNLKRLLCFTDADHSPLLSNLIRQNAHHLQILHGNRLSVDDVLYLFKAEGNELKMLCVEEFNEYKTTDIAVSLDNDGRTAAAGFIKDLKKMYSRLKYQTKLEMLVLPVNKYSSNFKFVEHYITKRCTRLNDLWFISNQQLVRKKVLMSFNEKKEEAGSDGPEESVFAYRKSKFGKVQSLLEQFLSERYIKQVYMTLPSKADKAYKRKKSEMAQPHIKLGGRTDDGGSSSNSNSSGSNTNGNRGGEEGEKGVVYEMPKIRHMNRPWDAQIMYRCDLGKWRKDLADDYMSRTLRSIVNSQLKS